MRFTTIQENDLVGQVYAEPDEHLVLPDSAYERDDGIRIYRSGLRYWLNRYLFEVVFEREPDGYLLRTCDRQGCQNPHHYRESPSTRTPKPKKSKGPSAPEINAAKTHCPAGHEYTPENTYISKDRYGTHRKCVICTKERVRESRSHTRERAPR